MIFSIVFWLHHGQICAIVPLQIMRLVGKTERSCLQSLTEGKELSGHHQIGPPSLFSL